MNNTCLSVRRSRTSLPLPAFVVAFMAILAGGAVLEAMPLSMPVSIGTVTSPRDWLVLADLDGDVRCDIACAAPGGGVRWWRNAGGGAFTVQADIPIAGGAPVAAIAANFDRDGDTDLVLLIDPGNGPGKIYFLENLGNNGFVKSSEVVLSGKLIPGSQPIADDFDRDGDLDVLVAHQDAAQSPGNDPLVFLANDSVGNFAAPSTLTSALNWPTALAFHDCDRNGLKDLVIGTSGTPQMRVYSDFVVGAFLVAELVPSPPTGIAQIHGPGPGWLYVRYNGPTTGADNGIRSTVSVDSLLDMKREYVGPISKDILSMAVTDAGETYPTDIFFLTLDPQTQVRTLVFLAADRNPMPKDLLDAGTARTVRCADMDGDGDNDVVMLGSTDLVWMQSESIRPATVFNPTDISLTLPHPAVDVLAVGDFLPDNGEEVAGAITVEGSIRVFALKDEQLQPGVVITSAAPGITAMKTADLDRDGDLDFVFNSPGDGRVRWLRNNGDGTFAAPLTILAKSNPGPLDVADIDRDGDPDVVMTFGDGSLIIAMNNGNSTPGWAMENGGSFGFLTALEVKVADTTAGGRQEIFVQRFAFGSPASSLLVFRHLVFPSPGWYSQEIGSGTTGARGIAVADVEPDGDLDVIAGPGLRPSLYLNNGTGAFAAPVMAAPADFTGMKRLSILDFERDGKAEVFAVAGSKLLVAPVNGAGFSSTLPVLADFSGHQLNDVAVLTGQVPNEYLVVSDATTPALRLVKNNRHQILHDVKPASTGPDLRGGRSVVYSVSLKNPAPASGPDIFPTILSFRLDHGNSPLPGDIFMQAVEAAEIWLDEGTPGELDSADTLVFTEPPIPPQVSPAGQYAFELPSSGNSPLKLIPQQTSRYLVAFKFNAEPVPGLDGFSVSWGGPLFSSLAAYAVGKIRHHPALVADGPFTTRLIQFSNLTPLQQWRVGHWGAPQPVGLAADAADPDGDGVANLVEYLLGTHPLLGSEAALDPFIDALGRRAVSIALSDPPRPDVTVWLEASTNLEDGQWNPFASRVGAAGWTGLGFVTPGPIQNGRQMFSFAEPPPGQGPDRFVRLRVTY